MNNKDETVFDRTFFRFVLGFLLIISISLGLTLLANKYKEDQNLAKVRGGNDTGIKVERK